MTGGEEVIVFIYVIISPECWNKAVKSIYKKTSFRCLHTDAVSSDLRENVKLYKGGYIPKMAPPKWDVGSLGVRGVWGIMATLRVRRKAHPHGTILTK